MRIQNNITAMNTHRQYTINNDNVAKSAEKLSSGYRINRAGDDAAGLAISEKMRSQIRGLNMATKNSQDAISLVQTAEGALQETHSMLQRMNELAVQAATGTNQDEDRLALAKEFEQLKREINDIADQTTFNNMKILDGSRSYTGYVRSVQTAGINSTVEQTGKSEGISPLETAVTDATGYQAATTGTQMEIIISDPATTSKLNLTGASSPTAGTSISEKSKVTLDLGELGKVTLDGSAANLGNTSLGAQLAAAITAGTSTGNVTLEGAVAAGGFTASYAGGKITINGPAAATATTTNYTEAGIQASVKIEEAPLSAGTVSRGSETAGNRTQVQIAGANTNIGATATAGKTYTINLKDGTGKVIGTVTSKEGTGATGELIGSLFNGATVKLDNGEEFQIDYGSAANTMKLESISTSGATSVFTGLDTTGTWTAELSTSTDVSNIAMDTDKLQNGEQAKAEAGPTAARSETNIAFNEKNAAGEDQAHVKSGDKLTINGNEYTMGSDFTDLDSLVSAINAKDGSNVVASKGTDANGNDTLVVTQALDKAGDPTGTGADKFDTYKTSGVDVTWSGAAGEGTKTTTEFDFAKIQVGDKFKVTVGGNKSFEVEKTANDTRDSFMNKIADKVGKSYDEGFAKAKVNGSAIIAEDQQITVEWAENGDSLKDADTNAMRIQVGALENEQLAISIDSMNTAGLKLDGANLDTQDNAGAAITAVRAAVGKVSDQRATLGAMQNRLDHKIANLKVSSENLSAAESRIRDVDMAEEMSNFTKNNILSQAATAMLAQANALPQNVLSLLG